MSSFRVALATASVASCLMQAAAAMPKLEDRGIEARISVTDRTGLHKEVWGATAFAATYARWSKQVPQSLRKYVKWSEDPATLEAESILDIFFVSELKVGSAREPINLILDTGSPNTWIKAGDTSGNSVAYHPEKSETAIEIEDSEFRIHYADGDFAWGSVWLDTLELSPTLIVPNTSIGAATYMSDRLRADSVTTGLMGISKALEATTRPPTPTIIETLSLHLAPDQRFIGVDLRANSSAGQYTFGALPTRLYTSADVRWAAPVPDSGHWDFGVSRFRLGAMAPDVWVKRPFVATADTGTTLLMLPRNVVEVYYSALPAAHKADEYGGAWVFPCADEAPDFEFWVGDGDGEDDGYRGRVPGAYVRYAPASHDDPDTCFGGIQDVELMLEGVEDKPDAIFGDVALKSMFVAFDIEEGRVGFADKELEVCSFDRSCQGNPLDAGELKGWGQ
ncbi:Aspergillopepsin-1 like protein [Verticillium longisporum]|uniref:Aspergillopepsin-1 like protein n=1 Tax=Verticillium longisporum TaxID=100787 RepID=A0A8I3AUW9_VERLO|nr:Aspergillopepsin-1 like protein [Verticillium longisporum]